MKIAFLSRYLGVVNRGVESHVLELSKRLKNYKVDILTQKKADSLNLILRGNYDLVIPTNGRMQSLKVSVGRLMGGYKTVIVGHAGIGRDDIWNIFFTIPNVFVALTDFQLQWAKKWAWNSKLVKIPNGVDLEKFNPSGNIKKIDLEKPIILSVGALEWYKFHKLSIAAVSKLKKGSLLIIGTGSEYPQLKKLGEKLLGSNRFSIIKADYNDMPNYYKGCDLFVLPSWDREAFGIVYLEAMACNLAVVAPNDNARKEIIGDGGILVDTSKIEKYSQAIEAALNMNWKNIPRKQAEKFSWDIVAKKYNELFLSMFKL